MASCRCGDIRNVNSMISALSNAQRRVENLSARRNQLKTKQSALCSHVQDGFSSSEMSNLKNKIEELDDQLDSTCVSFYSRVGNRKSELSNHLRSLQNEDRQHHEEERRRREEEARRAAEAAARAAEEARQRALAAQQAAFAKRAW